MVRDKNKRVWGKNKRSAYVPKRNFRRRRQVNVNRALAPFAQRYITTQKYSDTFYMSNASPFYQFNLNSLFDPDRTGLGHQPHGYDTMSSIYNRYRVIKCSWVINFYSTTSPVRLAACPANEAVAPVNVSDLVENPRTRWKVSIPGGNTQTLRGSIYLPSLMGRNKAQYMADDRYQALVTGSPNELGVLNIFQADIGTDTPTSTVNAVITLTYTSEFFDVKNLARS